MFKPGSGRKPDSGVWRYFDYESSADKSRCKVPDCGVTLKGKNATNLLTHLRSKDKGDKTTAEQLDKAEQDRKKKDLKPVSVRIFFTFYEDVSSILFKYFPSALLSFYNMCCIRN